MNPTNQGVIRCLLASLLLAGAGCTVLPPQQDQSRFFVLTAVSDGAPPTANQSSLGREISVGIGPVRFPGYLKRPEIVTRVGADQLEVSEDKRWAEPLDSNFQRVLGQDLAQQLHTQRIVMFPWYGTAQIDYQVEIQVSRFDTNSDHRSELTARWIIKDGKTGTALFATETTTSTAAAADDTSGSTALSRDVSVLSREIAERITELNRKRATAPKPGTTSAVERTSAPGPELDRRIKEAGRIRRPGHLRLLNAKSVWKTVSEKRSMSVRRASSPLNVASRCRRQRRPPCRVRADAPSRIGCGRDCARPRGRA